MITTLRIDDALKAQCDAVLDDMGLNLSCAITIFLKELTRRRAMPFAIRASGSTECENSLADRYREKRCTAFDPSERGYRAKKIFAEMRQTNNRDWTLDEINAEVSAARAVRHSRKRV